MNHTKIIKKTLLKITVNATVTTKIQQVLKNPGKTKELRTILSPKIGLLLLALYHSLNSSALSKDN